MAVLGFQYCKGASSQIITHVIIDSKKQKGKVVDVVEKGYMLKDKVIRYSKVVIGE